MKKLLMIGIVAGSVFGWLLKVIEQLTDKKVYTLLLNIDYIPFLKEWNIGEFVEFLMHLFVSIIVVFILYNFFTYFKCEHLITPYVLINVLIGVALFPTTSFSSRTPEFIDSVAFLYWLGGHVIFGLIVGLMIRSSFKNN